MESGEDEEIVDFPDYLLSSRCFRPKVDLSSRNNIDDFIKRYIYMSADEIRKLGYIDLVYLFQKKMERMYLLMYTFRQQYVRFLTLLQVIPDLKTDL